MKASLDDLHEAIALVAALDKNGITKTSLAEIAEIPEKDWATLRDQLFTGKVQVRELAASPVSFGVFASESDLAGFKFFNVLTFLLPIVAVGMALAWSWWWLFLAGGALICFRIAKSFYRTIIFQGVTASETAFCFLFSRNTICLLLDGAVVLRKNP